MNWPSTLLAVTFGCLSIIYAACSDQYKGVEVLEKSLIDGVDAEKAIVAFKQINGLNTCSFDFLLPCGKRTSELFAFSRDTLCSLACHGLDLLLFDSNGLCLLSLILEYLLVNPGSTIKPHVAVKNQNELAIHFRQYVRAVPAIKLHRIGLVLGSYDFAGVNFDRQHPLSKYQIEHVKGLGRSLWNSYVCRLEKLRLLVLFRMILNQILHPELAGYIVQFWDQLDDNGLYRKLAEDGKPSPSNMLMPYLISIGYQPF